MLVKRKQKGRGIYDSIMNFGARITDDAKNPKNRLYPGEKHALLYRDDLKRYEPAQYMGPGTNLRTRTLLNQMGLTPADRMATGVRVTICDIHLVRQMMILKKPTKYFTIRLVSCVAHTATTMGISIWRIC